MKTHKFDKLTDILALSEDEFGRFIPDLAAWFLFAKDMDGLGGEVTSLEWVDDGKPGEIHSVKLTIKETGETQIVKGSAFS